MTDPVTLRDLVTLESRLARLETRLDGGDVPLREHFESRMKAQEERVVLALTAADRAVTKAEQAAEKRFESLNEFRGALSDQQAKLPTRGEMDAAIAVLSVRLDSINDRVTRAEGKGAGAWQAWVALGGLVALAATLIGLATR